MFKKEKLMNRYIYNKIRNFWYAVQEKKLITRAVRRKYGELTYENYCKYLNEK